MNKKTSIVSTMVLINFMTAAVISYAGNECESDSYYKPHPNDCALFFQCSPNGTYILHVCPGELHFNPILNVCDYSELVGCYYNGSTNEPGPSEETTLPEDMTTNLTTDIPNDVTIIITTDAATTTDVTTDITPTDTTDITTTDITTTEITPTDITPTDITPTDITTSNITTSNITPTPSGECTNGEYLPHEYSCEAFYKCVAGTFMFLLCPDGMQFNITSRGCEFHDGDCNEPEQSTPSPDITTTAKSIEKCANNEFQSHESDCEAFYRCISGEFVLLHCPIGMHFNGNTRQCDVPEVAGCELVEVKCTNGEYQPHPTDCEAFYLCINDSLIIVYCPVGMHFNWNSRSCDSPQNAECSQ